MAIEVEIDKMTENDLEEVTSIEKNVFSDPWPKRAFRYDLTADFARPIVVRADNRIAGYASLYIAADELTLGNIAVAPDYQHRGIGSKILEYIIDLAVKFNIVQIALEVRESNKAALRLYSKYGFQITGRRKFYYRNPTEDALMMIKGIS